MIRFSNVNVCAKAEVVPGLSSKRRIAGGLGAAAVSGEGLRMLKYTHGT